MILSRDFLRRAKTQFAYESYDNYHKRVFNENHALYTKYSRFDIFLSHSYLDRDEVLSLVHLFNTCNYAVYVDWLYDGQLDRTCVSMETAALLRIRMDQSRGLAFLVTSNSTNSKWCPWELGYFDGKSNKSRCCILPVLSHSLFDNYQGQEFLGLYPYLQYEKYAHIDAYDFWVFEQNSSKYISLRAWLTGNDPIEHE